MVQFVVKGPFEVPLRKGVSGGTYVDEARLEEVLAESPDHLKKPGCYVFACTAPRGSLPVYVGQASKNIFREAFNPRNVNNINNYLSYRKRGRIDLYVIHQNAVKGDTGNKGCIDDIEDFLIGYASRRNCNLLNIHGARTSQWSIVGVANNTNGAGGHPGSSVMTFKKMMGMATRKDKVATATKVEVVEAIEPEKVESVVPNTGEAEDIDKSAIEGAENGCNYSPLCGSVTQA
jgi:hypothetical protein